MKDAGLTLEKIVSQQNVCQSWHQYFLLHPGGTSVPKFFHTMRRQFTDWEWHQIRSTSPDETSQLKLFYRLWVRSMHSSSLKFLLRTVSKGELY